MLFFFVAVVSFQLCPPPELSRNTFSSLSPLGTLASLHFCLFSPRVPLVPLHLHKPAALRPPVPAEDLRHTHTHACARSACSVEGSHEAINNSLIGFMTAAVPSQFRQIGSELISLSRLLLRIKGGEGAGEGEHGDGRTGGGSRLKLEQILPRLPLPWTFSSPH